MSVVGVDLGGTKILARLVDPETGKSSGRVKAPTPGEGPAAVIDAIVGVVHELENDLDRDDNGPIGVGAPGLIDGHGVVLHCPNIPGWDRPVPLAAELSARLGRSVVVGNDVNCGALGELRLGAGRGYEDLLAVFVGTGVGGGIVLDGRVRTGPRGQTGEIGHITTGTEGRVCGCGGIDHLETYAGRAGIEREARRLAADGTPSRLVELAGPSAIKSRHIFKALAEGCEITMGLMDGAADALATGIGNVASVLDIECVVLGGGVVDKLGQEFLDQIEGSSHFGGFGPQTVKLRLGERLDDAGVVGAAILASEGSRAIRDV